jgi:hypothetical protein
VTAKGVVKVDLSRLFQSSQFRALLTGAMIVSLGVAFIKVSENPLNTSPIWLMGFAALLASFVALFGDGVRRWIWRPHLTISYVPGPDYCEAVSLVVRGNEQVAARGYYFRLLIENKGALRAEKVEVLLTTLRHVRSDGTRPVVRRYSMNLKWTHIGIPILEGISSKMERFCDIGHVMCPEDIMALLPPGVDASAIDSHTATLTLDIETQPNLPINVLRPGKYELGLWVCAANHQPVQKVLEIDISGRWTDDLQRMVNDEMRIQLI